MSISNIIGTTQATAIAYPKKTTAQQFIAATQAQPYKGDDTVTISQAAKDQQAASQTNSTSAKSTSNYDFTNMSPKQMLGAVNDLIKSGKMSLDESSSLVGMMGNSQLIKATNASSTADISNQPVDFIAKLKQLIAFDQSINNTAGIEYANKALSALERLHGTINPQAESAETGSKNEVTNMTPNQMRDTAQDLFDSGKIDRAQHFILLTTGLTLGNIRGDGKYIQPTEAKVASHTNTPMDYVQYSKDRINYIEWAGLTTDPQSGYESWKGLLATLQGMTSSGAA